jgi:hypothetical protein
MPSIPHSIGRIAIRVELPDHPRSNLDTQERPGCEPAYRREAAAGAAAVAPERRRASTRSTVRKRLRYQTLAVSVRRRPWRTTQGTPARTAPRRCTDPHRSKPSRLTSRRSTAAAVTAITVPLCPFCRALAGRGTIDPGPIPGMGGRCGLARREPRPTKHARLAMGTSHGSCGMAGTRRSRATPETPASPATPPRPGSDP